MKRSSEVLFALIFLFPFGVLQVGNNPLLEIEIENPIGSITTSYDGPACYYVCKTTGKCYESSMSCRDREICSILGMESTNYSHDTSCCE